MLACLSVEEGFTLRRLGAIGAFYHVKGKHLLPADYIWQACVPDTQALVIFKALQGNPPPLVTFITAPTFLDFIG